MGHETSIRLPARLVGVVRADGPAPVLTPPLTAAPPAPPPPASPARPHPAERERVAQAVQALNAAADTLHASTRHLAQAIEPLAVELAIAVATRFLQAKTIAGEFPLRSLIRQAIERLEPRHPVQVLLSNEDLAAIRQQLADDPEALGSVEVGLKADPTLPRGSFRLQAHDRALVFDLETRLAALRQTLLDAVAGDEAMSLVEVSQS